MNAEFVVGPDPVKHGDDDPEGANSTIVGTTWSLTPLKTILELQAGEETIDVHVIQIPVKSAREVLSKLSGVDSKDFGINLQHLRRFAKFNELPARLKSLFSNSSTNLDNEASVPVFLYLIGTPAAQVSVQELKSRLPGGFELPASEYIWTVPVPLSAPISQEQADIWSKSLWPTVYKKSNPHGPHPSIVSRSQDEIATDMHIWMDLAARVGRSGRIMGLGEAIGVVIVERQDGQARAIAVAADARWCRSQHHDGVGNVMAHAVLRAIAMYSHKLRDGQSKSKGCFEDCPILLEEQAIYDATEKRPDGYLCHNLEVYMTHEPCVMCSMALLHSRFGRVVFGHRMPKTGGLCSDSEKSSGHGLFWRRDLNWCILAWEVNYEGGGDRDVGQFIHA